MNEAGDLSPEERDKLEIRLHEWLAGEGTAKELRFAPTEPEGVDEVRVVVEVSEPPDADRVAAIDALGVPVVPGETILFGQVSRASLLALARDPLVVRIEPDAVLPPFDGDPSGEGS
jgi:hypothetical protein